MTKTEKDLREDLAIEKECLRKLDIVRNELIPYYGGDCTLDLLEELLWNQYIKYNNLVRKVFEK